MNGTSERGSDADLAESIALALHLNSKQLPKRQKHLAITYGAYGRLAHAVVAGLRLAGWHFTRDPPQEGIRSHR